MELLEAVKIRHTIRNYDELAIEGEILKTLEEKIAQVNEEGNLHLQLVNGKENAFDDFSIRYGRWTGVTNYIACIGKTSEDLHQRVGDYGQQIVLWAQTVGLKTGWVETQIVNMPSELSIGEDEELVLSIAIGYSEKNGANHRVKSIEDLSTVVGQAPEWFYKGMEIAQLAPTAGNQQLFNIKYEDGNVSISTTPGFLEKVDLGIGQYHFELGSGKDHTIWK